MVGSEAYGKQRLGVSPPGVQAVWVAWSTMALPATPWVALPPTRPHCLHFPVRLMRWVSSASRTAGGWATGALSV